MLGVGVACELAEPWCCRAIVNLMGAVGHQFDAVLELVGVQSLQTVKRHFCISGELVAEEHLVVLASEERETDVGAVFYGSIAQWFATCHRSGSSQIVGVIRSKALRSVSALRYAEHINTGGIDFAR